MCSGGNGEVVDASVWARWRMGPRRTMRRVATGLRIERKREAETNPKIPFAEQVSGIASPHAVCRLRNQASSRFTTWP